MWPRSQTAAEPLSPWHRRSRSNVRSSNFRGYMEAKAFLPDFQALLGKFLHAKRTIHCLWVNSSATTAKSTITKITQIADLETFGGFAKTSHSSPAVFSKAEIQHGPLFLLFDMKSLVVRGGCHS